MLFEERTDQADKLYLLLNTMNPKRGGLTRNLLQRAKLLSEGSRYEVHILTFDFNPDYNHIYELMKEKKLINHRMYIHNLYEYLEEQSGFSEPERPAQTHPIEEVGMTVEPVNDSNAYRIYRDGIYIKYKNYDAEGRLRWIDYFNENRYRTKRETYDYQGRLRRVTYMDYLKNKPKQIRYFDKRGCCYLTKWFNPENNLCTRVNLFYDDSKKIDTFKDEHHLKINWLDRLANDSPGAIFQTEITQLDKTDELILGMENKEVAKVKMIHSNHLKYPSKVQGPLLEAHEKAIHHAPSFDAMVFITQKQKEDVRKRFGPLTTYHAIPHSAPIPESGRSIKRDPWKAVCIARFSASKNLDHAIKAFRKVVTKFPKAQLELWGYGSEEKALRKLIKKLKLEEHVFIKGFTHEALDVFRGAAFSVFCSKREGFGLVIAESMSVGTPVISYDINYGPQEMISHEENGLLIPMGKIDQLATAMMDLFAHQDKRERFGKAACNIVETMNEKTYLTRWVQAYDHIQKKKKHQINGLPRYGSLTEVKLANNKTVRISGTVHLQNKKCPSERRSVFLHLHHPDHKLTQEFPIKVIWSENGKGSFTTEIRLSDLTSRHKSATRSWKIFLNFSEQDFPTYLPLRAQRNITQSKRVFFTQGLVAIRSNQQGNVILTMGKFLHIYQGLKEKMKKRIRRYETSLKKRLQRWLQVPN
ncbi:glycosyltransferase [Marininema halotolerans]|uniref:Poly(Glycerol-phosphate) alpha-glucosyltransferase n=1 Tax=Marininema halotolerans TaxID=1155944 RepID=A0A1I6SJW6_9BACL|nr:glycosyltransferase [Marininema halotolerans]SFS77233.1 poly(glycerol-phosphate) alpha-glucosyltransferase [Marininema halotolerans]